MDLISTVCQTGPMKSAPCFAVLGVRVQEYVLSLLVSVAIGLMIAYLVRRKIDWGYFLLTAGISLIFFLVIAVFIILDYSRRIY